MTASGSEDEIILMEIDPTPNNNNSNDPQQEITNHNHIDEPIISNNITNEEAEIYDRQIRVWGMEAQNRLRNSNILVIGTGGLGLEILKNLVLAGVGQITIADNGKVDFESLSSNYYFQVEDIGQERTLICVKYLRHLNPQVILFCSRIPETQFQKDYFEQFDLVVCTGSTFEEICTYNMNCRAANVKFICGQTYGFYSYCFNDLLNHEYVEEKKIKTPAGEQAIKTRFNDHYCHMNHLMAKCYRGMIKNITKELSSTYMVIRLILCFESLYNRPPRTSLDYTYMIRLREELFEQMFEITDCLMGELTKRLLPDSMVKEVMKFGQGELLPVCSILGGVMSQEVLKVLSGKDRPLYNIFCMDALQNIGIVHQCIPLPEEEEIKELREYTIKIPSPIHQLMGFQSGSGMGNGEEGEEGESEYDDDDDDDDDDGPPSNISHLIA